MSEIDKAKARRSDCHAEVKRTEETLRGKIRERNVAVVDSPKWKSLNEDIARLQKTLDRRERAYTKARRHVRRLRRRLEDESKAPKYEPWMANGHEGHNLIPRAKDLLAIAVVDYDLVCTSITRSWGTGSHHEQIPTRGFDCAGARMTEFQRDLRYGRVEGFALGDLLELFGPDNDACADNGAPYTMAEGSGIESLHDGHCHAFVY